MKHLWTPWRMPYLMGERPSGGVGPGCIFCGKEHDDGPHSDYVLARGQTCYAIMNLYPYNNGHLMIIPYRHVSDLTDLAEEELAEIMAFTRTAVLVLKQAFHPQGFNIGINMGSAAGAGVAGHLHQHVVPRWSGDTNFLTVVGETRTIPEWIDTTYERLKPTWDQVSSS